MNCPTCQYDLKGLTQTNQGVLCPECGCTVLPGQVPRSHRSALAVIMLILPWLVAAGFTFRTGDTLSNEDVALNARVLPWMVSAAATSSVVGGILLARRVGRSRRAAGAVLFLTTVLNVVLFVLGWFLALACIGIGV